LTAGLTRVLVASKVYTARGSTRLIARHHSAPFRAASLLYFCTIWFAAKISTVRYYAHFHTKHHYLLAEINWLLIFYKLLHSTSCLHRL